jgi:adenine/guanine phosphoribosyltransferase-like PRPP-binding protein
MAGSFLPMKTVTYTELAKILESIIKKPGADLRNIEFVVGVSRGGLFPAMVVATKIVKPLIIAYIDKQDNVYFDRAEWIRDKKVLLVDDIVRTGKTMNKIKKLLLATGAISVATLTPYFLEKAKRFAPDYGFVTRDDIKFPWDG